MGGFGSLRMSRRLALLASILLISSLISSPLLVSARRSNKKFILLVSDEDGKKSVQDEPDSSEDAEESPDWDEFGDLEEARAEDLDPGSWRRYLEDQQPEEMGIDESLYQNGVQEMFLAFRGGDPAILEAAVRKFQEAADKGNPHAQSTLAFLYGCGSGVEQSDVKSFLYHSFAAEGGNFQSKLALAYSYFRRQMHEDAVKLYAELAGTAVTSFSASIDSPLVEPVPLNDGLEENKEALRRSRGEEDDDFQILEYQARKGNAGAMFKVGVFYYSGLRGVRRDHGKALQWFLKAVEKGDSTAMELLGEIYARGHGVERNFTRALEWFKAASRQKRFSAYNGIGYLYVRGQGVEKRNYTMARDFFKKAAEHKDPDGHYNLGVLYLIGKGVRKDVDAASKHFVNAANDGHPKAYYQLAKLFHKGVGMKKDLATAVALYKIVAERGPWGSLMRWALESYLKKDIGKALLLYSRAAELGYEVAQSNAAWMLEKYTEEEHCLGETGFCSSVERHQRAHTLWWHASEQGNDDAALLIGDAYYYGRGTEKDLERAAGAYMHARLQANAQAIFNLGYMHEHGQGLPLDLHLAKRYYDEALQTEPAAALPVYLALTSLWLRQHNKDGLLVKMIDMLPEVLPKAGKWLKKVLLDEGNITFMTLLVCLMTVLYIRQRRIAAQVTPPPPQ